MVFEFLFFKVTVFAEGWMLVASGGRAVTYIGSLIVLRLDYYGKGRKMRVRKRVAARERQTTGKEFRIVFWLWYSRFIGRDVAKKRSVLMQVLGSHRS